LKQNAAEHFPLHQRVFVTGRMVAWPMGKKLGSIDGGVLHPSWTDALRALKAEEQGRKKVSSR
jgi:hypothetical protein